MAHLTINRKSGALGKESVIHIIVPNAQLDHPYKVLYLLHGLSDDASCWSRYTDIERYAKDGNAMIVMPDGGRSFYADTVYGENYFTYLTKELPQWIQFMFPISTKRKDTFIAGLSMGGYGAFKAALSFPEVYGGVAGFSSVCDIKRHCLDESLPACKALGKTPDWDAVDLFALAKQADKAEEKPKIYQWCGFSDFLYQDNKKLQKHIESLSFDYHFFESDGDHMWSCWNDQIGKAMQFFGLLDLS